ncbi:MAG: hypothetical protein ABGY43_06310 [bacterium]
MSLAIFFSAFQGGISGEGIQLKLAMARAIIIDLIFAEKFEG